MTVTRKSKADSATSSVVAFDADDAAMDAKRGRCADKSFLKLCQRTVFFVALFILVGIFLLQVYQCLEKFASEPTYVSTHIVNQEKAQFPAITICPISKGYKEDVLLDHGISPRSAYNDLRKGPGNWTSSKAGVSRSELFELVTYEPGEIVKEIYVRFNKYNPDVGDNYVKVQEFNSSNMREQRHRGFGRCYTYHPAQNYRNYGIYYMKFTLRISAKLYLHRNEQFLDLTGRMGYKISLGERTESQVNYEDISQLERFDSVYLDGNLTCKVYESFDNCINQALENHMMKAHSCVVPWIISNQTICTDPDAMNDTFWMAWNRVTNQRNDCFNPCMIVLTSVGGKNLITTGIANDTALAYFYFAPKVMKTTEHYFYTALSLLAEIGGYLGLLLGVSLWHFASWVADSLQDRINKIEAEEEKKAKKMSPQEGAENI